nr:hypothetical protein [Tanacetum cinerariifolium]
MKQGTEVTKDQVQTLSSQSTAPVQPPVTQSETQTPVSEPVVAPVSVSMPNLKPSIPYPLRRDNERPLIGKKEKLSEMARTPMNEHCSAVILNKLPRKLGDPGKFLIPCEFPGIDECLALADLGASINLMPLSVWEGLLLPKLTPTCMTLKLTDRSVSKPIGIAKDVSVKVGVFHFPADFVVIDFKPDPRVPLILKRCFLKTDRALIDVHKGELTLRIGNEAITYNLDQEVLGFSDVTASGNPTPYDDLIVPTTSLTLTLFGDSDFLLFEEADAFLGLEDDPNSLEFDPSYYDPKEDILLLEAILNSKPLPPLPNHDQYLPSFKKELKYAFLEGDNKLPVIIAKELGDEDKTALIKVLKSHKRAIAWKLSDIQGLVIVLPGSVPDPEDEAILDFKSLDTISVKLANCLRHTLRLRNMILVSRSLISWRLINLESMKLAMVEIRLVEITTSVLIKIIPPIEIFLIILMERKTERAGVEDEAIAEDWFFLSKSNALTISLSSETSDEIAGVEELVLTLARTALARV